MLVKIDWTVPQPILLKLSSPSFFGFFRLFFLLQLRWFMRWFMLHFFHCGPSCWRRCRGFRNLLGMCKDITSATSSATVPPIIFECPVNLKECYFIWNASEFCLNCTATHLAQNSSPSFFGFFRLFFLLQLRWFMRWFMLHFFHCGPSCWRRRRGFRRLLRMCKDITSATSSATVPPIIFECPVNLKECYFEKC